VPLEHAVRLAQKLNHWGCASAFAVKFHVPLCGTMNLALALRQQRYFCTRTSNGVTACQTAFYNPVLTGFLEMDATIVLK